MINEKRRSGRKRVRKNVDEKCCNKLCQKLKIFFSKIRTQAILNIGLKLKRSGYVLILMLVSIPAILFGIKYVMDKMTENQVKIDLVKGTLTYYKKCAKEAALAVAKNWNPGLNLSHQKDALMKIADAVYNDSPCYIQGNTNLYEAVPGLEIKSNMQLTNTNETFGPIKVDYDDDQMITQASVMASKEIKYTNANKYLLRYYRGYYSTASDGTGGGYENVYHRIWRETDLNTNPSHRYSYFDEIDETKRAKLNYILIHHDIYGLPCRANPTDLLERKNDQNQLYYPNNSFFWPECSNFHNRFAMTIPSTSSTVSQYSPSKYHTSSTVNGNLKSVKKTYKKRTAPSGTDPITITIDNDRIKVTTDSSTNRQGTVAYAKPAQLNVDIVLAIPVNGAASNINNNDSASPTAEYPSTANEYTQSSTYPNQSTPTFSSNTKNTPLYQMGQACKNFVKDNFYHIRGITMGLIPYSAKVSINPDKAQNYTIAIPQFVEYTPWTNPSYPTATMYGTSGERNAPLVQDYKTKALAGSNESLTSWAGSDTPYYWGGMLTGCPIMCRRGTVETWNGTQAANGDLLSNAAPSSGDQYKYMRMNLNPCLAGYANQLSMKCERKCTHFFPNPYYMIEPTADLVKIYEMCNALFPIYDPNNVSNFLFIPFEWANNFWQSWTSDVKISAGTDTLSRQSKTTSGRKKVLVMLVNKPDWFEPGELTYLGFDNDNSFVPLSESDKIDFRIDYSDTSKKFLDGSCYNTEYTSGEFNGIKNKNSDGTPLISGPKKIIRFENQSGFARNNTTGDFECTGDGTGRLYIPRKALVRLTVSANAGTITFTNVGDTTAYTIRDEKTFNISESNITSTSESEYYVEFTAKKLKLISAEVTNLSYSYINPINTSYSEVEWIGSGGSNTNIKWGTRVEIEQRTGTRRISKTCTKTVPKTCTKTVPKTCTKTVPKTCTKHVEKTCSRTVQKKCTKRIKNTCTKTVPKTCTKHVEKTCSRNKTTYGAGYFELRDKNAVHVSEKFELDGDSNWRWYFIPHALNKKGAYSNSWDCGIAYGNRNFVTMTTNGDPAYSKDYGLTWEKPDSVYLPIISNWNSIVWNGTYFVILTKKRGYSTYSSHGVSWEPPTESVGSVYNEYLDDDLGWDGTRLFALGDDQCVYVTTEKKGVSGWKQYGCDIERLNDREKWKYDNNYYVKSDGYSIMYSSFLKGPYNKANSPCGVDMIDYGSDYWLGLTANGHLIKSTNSTPKKWADVNSYLSYFQKDGPWSGLCYGNDRWVANTTGGDIAILTNDTIPNMDIPAQNISQGDFKIEVSDDNYTYQGAKGWYTKRMNSNEKITIYSPSNNDMELDVESYIPTDTTGSITFYNDNGVTENLGTYNISDSKTFTFKGYSDISGSSYSPGPNFGNNYSDKKIHYNGVNVSLEAYIPSGKQLLRWTPESGSDSGFDLEGDWPSDTADSTSFIAWGIKDGYFYWDIEPIPGICESDCGMYVYYTYTDTDYSTFNGKDVYGNDLSDKYNCYQLETGHYYKEILSNRASKHTNNGTNYWGATYPIIITLKSPNIYFRVNGFFVRNVYERKWGGMNRSENDIQSNLCVTANEEWIKFNGDSKCIVTVGKKTTPDPSYVRVNSAQNDSLTTKISSSDWIMGSNGIYHVTLYLKNACLSSVNQPDKIVPEEYDCSYDEEYDCSYDEEYDCSYDEEYDCPYDEEYDCSYDEKYDCSYDEEYDCSYDEEYDCSYDEEYDCSYDEEYTYNVNVTYPALRTKGKYTITYSYMDSGTRYVKTTKSSDFLEDNQDGDYKYYIKLPSTTAVGKFAARKYSRTEAVYDVINFSANKKTNQNGCLSTNFNGTYGNNFYYFGSSVTKTLTTSQKGDLVLKVAPNFDADSGSIKMNSGNDTAKKTITAPKILTIKYSDLSNGTMNLTMSNCIILYVKLCNAEAKINAPAVDDSHQHLMWDSSTISTSGTNISLSGTYSNYSSDWGWHRLKYQSNESDRLCIWNDSYVSDITSVLDAKSATTLAYWYMPQNVYTDFENTNLIGPMRLFSPMTRDSSLTPRKYCQMYAYEGYENNANLLWHNFTLPNNLVLRSAGYQSLGGDATVAVKSATEAVCAKLKTDYGDNLRVYVVKYRKQDKYKTFPAHNVTQSDENHDYSVIDACATNTGGKSYDISTEADLKSTLNTIANDIKSFAGGVTAAKNV